MRKVSLVVASWCPVCPQARALWRQLKQRHLFEYEEIDINSPSGKELCSRHNILSVPTTIIDGEVVFVGVPEPKSAEAMVMAI